MGNQRNKPRYRVAQFVEDGRYFMPDKTVSEAEIDAAWKEHARTCVGRNPRAALQELSDMLRGKENTMLPKDSISSAELMAAIKAVQDDLAVMAKAQCVPLTQDEKRAYHTGREHQGLADGAQIFSAMLAKKLAG